MNRQSILIIVQRYATQSSLFIILQVHSTCFGCQPHPSSGVHKTVTTVFGTGQLPPSNVAKLAWLAVVTILCTPDDGCVWHPKHVEWTCRIINRLLCVASLWTIINIKHFLVSVESNNIYCVRRKTVRFFFYILSESTMRCPRKNSSWSFASKSTFESC